MELDGTSSTEVLADVSKEDKESSKNEKEQGGHGLTVDHPTSYVETLMHLFKGNVGPGLFALGDAFKNGGLIASIPMTIFLGFICVHSQHILINCSLLMKNRLKLEKYPDFAETVQLCFEKGQPKLRSWSTLMYKLVNIFLCLTQFGLCCVYFVFISSNLKQISNFYGVNLSANIIMTIIFIPILLPSLITNLKYLAPCSTFANICMILGIGITLNFTLRDLPDLSERNFFSSSRQLPLFFGTTIFAFEGISLVLPLKKAMKQPNNFDRPAGVLNVGMILVTFIFVTMGFFGYLKYGDEVQGSLTLNLPKENILAQSVKIMISMGVLLGYALQFFIGIEIMWPSVQNLLKIENHLYRNELLFRTFMVFVTFCIAQTVPKLSVFISLIGALCSTALALVFPPVIEMVINWDTLKSPSIFMILKNITILIVAVLGFATGTYESLTEIIKEFGSGS